MDGVVTFAGLIIDTEGVDYTLLATAGALTVESLPFDIAAP
jgi:hypothetical protein